MDGKQLEGWTEFVRDGSMEFHTVLKSRRLSQALDEVWQSIPVGDRLVICNRLTLVSDNSVLRYILADVIGYNAIGGVLYGCVVPYTPETSFVFLNALTMRPKPVAFVRYVVAHELAHVYHNHRNVKYEQGEAEADATAAHWGYPDTDPILALKIKTGKKLPKALRDGKS